jgi:hypothetical protein
VAIVLGCPSCQAPCYKWASHSISPGATVKSNVGADSPGVLHSGPSGEPCPLPHLLSLPQSQLGLGLYPWEGGLPPIPHGCTPGTMLCGVQWTKRDASGKLRRSHQQVRNRLSKVEGWIWQTGGLRLPGHTGVNGCVQCGIELGLLLRAGCAPACAHVHTHKCTHTCMHTQAPVCVKVWRVETDPELFLTYSSGLWRAARHAGSSGHPRLHRQKGSESGWDPQQGWRQGLQTSCVARLCLPAPALQCVHVPGPRERALLHSHHRPQPLQHGLQRQEQRCGWAPRCPSTEQYREPNSSRDGHATNSVLGPVLCLGA